MENFNDFNDIRQPNPNPNPFGNEHPNQYDLPPELRYKWLRTTSLVFGILSLISFMIIFINVPLGIIGLIFGIIYACLSKKMCSGIWINIGSMIWSIMICILIAFTISNTFTELEEITNVDAKNIIQQLEENENYTVEDAINDFATGFLEGMTQEVEKLATKVTGSWTLSEFNGDMEEGEPIISCQLNADNSFVWNKYNDRENNYVKGTYTVEDINMENGQWRFRIVLTGDEYVVNGKIKDEPYSSTYEMVIVESEEKTESVFFNVDTMNMYYGKK